MKSMVALAAAVLIATPASASINYNASKSNTATVTKVTLANGQVLYCRKAGGEQIRWQVFTLNSAGKQVPAPAGSYKQKNGNVIVVGAGGFVNPTSMIKFEPQPEPPEVSH